MENEDFFVFYYRRNVIFPKNIKLLFVNSGTKNAIRMEKVSTTKSLKTNLSKKLNDNFFH